MGLAFSKYEGLGNDFVLVDAAAWGGRTPDDARAICDRHTGVGADGVLVVDADRPSMHVINSDGSIAEMCGNGLRCVVWHLARRALGLGARLGPGAPSNEAPSRGRIVDDAVLVVETGAGPHPSRLVSSEGRAAIVEVRMRAPSLSPRDLPLDASAPLVDAPFLEGVPFTAVSMGNPHLVTFAEGLERLSLGPAVQRDPRLPEGANVGFARPATIEGRDGFVLDVLERGSGWTRACGTGACAAAVAAVVTNRAARHVPIPIRLPGGLLELTVGAEGEPVWMRGPARHVFDGELEALG
ncbi:MAG: diaminopimelate epimerase [Myxococcales bacterium]|nr:diaminopimelate epimerase [Myxococcales bacterium]